MTVPSEESDTLIFGYRPIPGKFRVVGINILSPVPIGKAIMGACCRALYRGIRP
jgi:hypothetical protein